MSASGLQITDGCLDETPYSGAIWGRFLAPKYAGLPKVENLELAEARTPAADAILQIGWVCDRDRITQTGFLAHGSPEVIAVAEMVSELLFNQLLTNIELSGLMSKIHALNLPPEKRYCALLAEDVFAQILDSSRRVNGETRDEKYSSGDQE